MEYAVTYLGEILDVLGSREAAEEERVHLATAIMAGKVPDLLGPEDFESYADCVASLKVEQMEAS